MDNKKPVIVNTMEEREKLTELLKADFCEPDEKCEDCIVKRNCYLPKKVDYLLNNGVIVPPCKIGDRLYGIRRFHGVLKVQEGIVNEMYYTKDMQLQIVIKSVCRGNFGKEIFLTKEDAEKALEDARR